MATVIWRNLTNRTLTWEAIVSHTEQTGQLDSNQKLVKDLPNVDFVGWRPANFTGLMVVSVPKSLTEPIEVYATQPGPKSQDLLDSLKSED